jgi:hypothetical protein
MTGLAVFMADRYNNGNLRGGAEDGIHEEFLSG